MHGRLITRKNKEKYSVKFIYTYCCFEYQFLLRVKKSL